MSLLLFLFFIIAVFVFIYLKYDWRLWGLTMFILSIILIPPHVKLFSFSISTIFSYTLTLYCILYLILNRKKKSDYDKLVYKYLFIVFIAYAIIIPLGKGVDMFQQLNYHKTTMLLLQFPFFTTVILQKKKDVQNIAKIIIYAIFIMTIYGVCCYITQSNPYITIVNQVYPDDVIESYDRYREETRGVLQGRISSTVLTPVFYAGVLITLFYIFLCIFFNRLKNQRRSESIFGIILFMLILLNIILTGTRSGIIGLAIGLLYVLYKILSYNMKAKIVFITITLSLILFNIALIFKDTFEKSNDSEITGSSVEMRTMQLEGTLDLLGEGVILFGLGHGWITDYMNNYGPHPVLLGFESIIFSGFIQYGIIGFILIYGSIFIGLYKLNKFLLVNCKNMRKEVYILNGFLLSYIVYAIMTGPFYMTFFLGSYIFLFKTISLYNED